MSMNSSLYDFDKYCVYSIRGSTIFQFVPLIQFVPTEQNTVMYG